MNYIDITGLAARLEKRFKRMGIEAIQKRAIIIKSIISDIAKAWRAEIKQKMLKPASARGTWGGSSKTLRPHNTLVHNQGFPMAVSEKLANAVWQRVTLTNTSYGASIHISKGISPVYRGTVDYGSILDAGGRNGANRVLKDFKARAYDILDTRIRKVAKSKGF